MEKYKKPTWRIIGKPLVVLLVFGILVGVLAFMMIKEAEHYKRVYDNPMTIIGTVTKYDSSEDSDDKTKYHSYVSYVADGREYADIRYETKEKSMDLTAKGTSVQLQVNTEDPSELISNLKENTKYTFIFLFIPIAFLALIWEYLIKSLRSKKLNGMPKKEVIKSDMYITVVSGFFGAFWLLAFIAYFIFWHWNRTVLGEEAVRFSLIFGVCWLIDVFIGVWDIYNIKKENYRIETGVLVRKRIDDTGDSIQHMLCFKSERGCWEDKVSIKKFDSVQEGDEVSSVYLGEKKKPIIYYHKKYRIH